MRDRGGKREREREESSGGNSSGGEDKLTNVRRGSFGGYATCRRRRRHHHHRRRRRHRRRCCRITGNRHTLPLSMLSRIGHDPTGVSYTFLSRCVSRATDIYNVLLPDPAIFFFFPFFFLIFIPFSPLLFPFFFLIYSLYIYLFIYISSFSSPLFPSPFSSSDNPTTDVPSGHFSTAE